MPSQRRVAREGSRISAAHLPQGRCQCREWATQQAIQDSGSGEEGGEDAWEERRPQQPSDPAGHAPFVPDGHTTLTRRTPR